MSIDAKEKINGREKVGHQGSYSPYKTALTQTSHAGFLRERSITSFEQVQQVEILKLFQRASTSSKFIITII